MKIFNDLLYFFFPKSIISDSKKELNDFNSSLDKLKGGLKAAGFSLLFFKNKDTMILSFLLKHTIKMDIIKYYSLPNLTELKLCHQKSN